MKLVGEESVINGATPSSFWLLLQLAKICLTSGTRPLIHTTPGQKIKGTWLADRTSRQFSFEESKKNHNTHYPKSEAFFSAFFPAAQHSPC